MSVIAPLHLSRLLCLSFGGGGASAQATKLLIPPRAAFLGIEVDKSYLHLTTFYFTVENTATFHLSQLPVNIWKM